MNEEPKILGKWDLGEQSFDIEYFGYIEFDPPIILPPDIDE